MRKKKRPVYLLKVTLKGAHPPVWRRFQVPADVSLYRLHTLLQAVMGWTNSHMHMFTIDGVDYGKPRAERGIFGRVIKDERGTKLNRVVPQEGMTFDYEYDFGDSWQHLIEVEKILPPEGSTRTACIAGAGACPPEDCGGIGGYEELLEAIADPQHPRHEELTEWLGEKFDPEAFDVEQVNRYL